MTINEAKRGAQRLAVEGRKMMYRHPKHVVVTVATIIGVVLTVLGGIGYLLGADGQPSVAAGTISIGMGGVIVALYALWSTHLFEQDQLHERRRLLEALQRSQRRQ